MNERSIFMAALERESAPERSAYLDEACGGDTALRQRVEALLASHQQAGSFLGMPVPERLAEKVATPKQPEETRGDAPATKECPRPLPEGLGSRIGPYKLLQEIGEGGMGTVWMAEQTQPVQRKVALKIIKPGMDSRQVIARFEAERQALALMDHPNIARVLDGGTTESGRPYFVMELVKGVPITKFCDEQRLTPRQRLELFVPVCQAVQHAHQKGIIHRDLKPSNVMVCMYDGRPVPKVIDFGVAKATGQKLTERTMFTEIGQVVGTLEYMSPEQAELNQLDIDTRSDIYSLGVLLYELLTGSTPLERKRLKSAAMLEVLRLIREEEPPRPSTRLSEAKETLPSISAQRQTEPARLIKLVRGELDWILMKALEKDRNRRYETANGFAMDIQRYLADEPVQACPPSAWYRLRKLARRNKIALTFSGLILFFIVLFGGTAGWVMRDRAARQDKVVNDLEGALYRAELLQEQGKRAEALAAVERVELLAGQAPSDSARDGRLAILKERLAAEERDQVFLARFEDIRLRAQSAFDYQKSSFFAPVALPEIRHALHDYGIDIGVTAPAEAAARVRSRPEAVYRTLIAAFDEYLNLTPREDEQTRQWLRTTLQAADNDTWRTRVRKAVTEHDWKSLELLTREVDVRQQPPSFLLLVPHNLPATMRSTKLELSRRIQRAYPADLWANFDLAYALEDNGEPAEAIRYYTAALALRPGNAGIYLNRGRALVAAGEVDAAIADYYQARALAPPSYAVGHNDLGIALKSLGKLDEAVACFQKAIALDPKLALAHSNLGTALIEMGKVDEAIASYRKAIDLDPKLAEAHANLANALNDKGKVDEAIACFRQAIAVNPKFAGAYFNLGLALVAKGQMDDAIACFRQATALDPKYAQAHNNLGNALKAQGKMDEAIACFRQAIAINPKFALAHTNLGEALEAKGQWDEAIAAFRETVRLQKDNAQAQEQLRQAERLGQLEQDKDKPKNTGELLALAKLCQTPYRERYADAVRFYQAAFSAEPKLAEDLRTGHRYNAACAAALAGCGQGKDADKLDANERGRLRRQALDWLRADLDAWSQSLNREPDKVRPIVIQQMRHWLADADFVGVRGPQALAKLPEGERQPWQKLWDDVANTLAHAQARTAPEPKAEVK
jgi:serine/threonine protein kinase/Flp pilus assembly protein TadD